MKKTSFDVQKEQSVSFMYFNRFLMLRYFTAFMFFRLCPYNGVN